MPFCPADCLLPPRAPTPLPAWRRAAQGTCCRRAAARQLSTTFLERLSLRWSGPCKKAVERYGCRSCAGVGLLACAAWLAGYRGEAAEGELLSRGARRAQWSAIGGAALFRGVRLAELAVIVAWGFCGDGAVRFGGCGRCAFGGACVGDPPLELGGLVWVGWFASALHDCQCSRIAVWCFGHGGGLGFLVCLRRPRARFAAELPRGSSSRGGKRSGRGVECGCWAAVCGSGAGWSLVLARGVLPGPGSLPRPECAARRAHGGGWATR